MRRKSERAKTGKASPEKTEKAKRGRPSRRRKASSSSEAECTEESSVQVSEVVADAAEPDPYADSQSETRDEKVWQVKSDDSASGTGEIKKLKICLSTRLPLTPEPEATPRSRKKLNRTLSETPSEGKEGEEKRKSRHKSRRSMRDSRDGAPLETPSEDDDHKTAKKKILQDDENVTQDTKQEKSISIKLDSELISSDISLDPSVTACSPAVVEHEKDTKSLEWEGIESRADTTDGTRRRVAPLTPTVKRRRSRRLSGSSSEREQSAEPSEPVKLPQISEEPESNCEQTKTQVDMVSLQKGTDDASDKTAEQSQDVEKPKSSEKPEECLFDQSENYYESKCEQSENTQENKLESSENTQESNIEPYENIEDSNIEPSENAIENKLKPFEKPLENINETTESTIITTAELVPSRALATEPHPDKRQSSEIEEIDIIPDKSTDSTEIQDDSKNLSPKPFEPPNTQSESDEVFKTCKSRRSKYSQEKESTHNSVSSDLTNLTKEEKYSNVKVSKSIDEPTETYNLTPIVVSRKRRWGSRVARGSQPPPVSISTDVLKDIIPDVKPSELEEAVEDKKQRRKSQSHDKPRVERPILPKIVIDNTENANQHRRDKEKESKDKSNDTPLLEHRKISIVKENNVVARPPSPARNKSSAVLYITNLVRPFTLAQLKNLLQRTGKIVTDGFWIDRIKSKCFVTYENEDQAIETRHALHGVTWPVSNPKTLQVDFSSQEHLERVRATEEDNKDKVSAIPGTVEDWLREQDAKKERFGEADESKPWDKKTLVREWDVGKGEKDKERERLKREERPREPHEKRGHRASERSPEPVRKLKKKEEEAPAKMLDDLFRKTKTVPCIYWLPLSAETIAVKEEQRRQHMAEHERRMQELERTRTHRRH